MCRPRARRPQQQPRRVSRPTQAPALPAQPAQPAAIPEQVRFIPRTQPAVNSFQTTLLRGDLNNQGYQVDSNKVTFWNIQIAPMLKRSKLLHQNKNIVRFMLDWSRQWIWALGPSRPCPRCGSKTLGHSSKRFGTRKLALQLFRWSGLALDLASIWELGLSVSSIRQHISSQMLYFTRLPRH